MKAFAWFLAGAVVARLVKVEIVADKPKSKRYAVPKDTIPPSTHKVTIC